MPERIRRRYGDSVWHSPAYLYPVLLLLLHRGDAHGYTLLEQVKEFGFEDLNPTAIYRRLREMEADGWVTSGWDMEGAQGPPRRVYHLTAVGDAALKEWVTDLQITGQHIDQFLQAYEAHMREGKGAHH